MCGTGTGAVKVVPGIQMAAGFHSSAAHSHCFFFKKIYYNRVKRIVFRCVSVNRISRKFTVCLSSLYANGLSFDVWHLYDAIDRR